MNSSQEWSLLNSHVDWREPLSTDTQNRTCEACDSVFRIIVGIVEVVYLVLSTADQKHVERFSYKKLY